MILDTVRADHLSLYGYARETTPRLAQSLRLDDGTVVYSRAYSTSNWTLPPDISLFTGLLPGEHGCEERTCGNGDAGVGSVELGTGPGLEIRTIDLEDTLAARLGHAGYRTAGVMGNPHLLVLDGSGEGFDVWRQARAPAELHGIGESLRRSMLPRNYANQRLPLPSAASVNRAVLRLFDDCTGGGCFIAANYIDAHSPYFPSLPYAGKFGQVFGVQAVTLQDSSEVAAAAAAAYDEEILELDAHLGALLHELARRGLLHDLWLFITSDHGESFLEHDSVRHGGNVYDDQVRIPLVVQPPRGTTLPPPLSPVSLLDVTATISAIATGETMGRGRDLRRADATSSIQVEFFGWESAGLSRLGAYAPFPSRVVVVGRDKLIEIDGRRELYDLAGDPRELHDRAAVQPELVERLVPLLPALEVRSNRVRQEGGEVSPETAEALRALGYVD